MYPDEALQDRRSLTIKMKVYEGSKSGSPLQFPFGSRITVEAGVHVLNS